MSAATLSAGVYTGQIVFNTGETAMIVPVTLTVGNPSPIPPATTTKLLPQVAFGGGWYTALYFANTRDVTVSVRIDFIADNGRPLVIPSIRSSTATLEPAPRGAALVEALNSGALQQGYASVGVPEGVIGYGIFRQSTAGLSDQEAVVPLASARSSSIFIWDETAFVTAVALANPNSVDNIVSIVLRDTTGQTIGTGSLRLSAGNKTAWLLRDVPGLSAMVGHRGTAEFSVTTGSIAALGLRFGSQAFTSIPVAEQ